MLATVGYMYRMRLSDHRRHSLVEAMVKKGEIDRDSKYIQQEHNNTGYRGNKTVKPDS